MHLQRIWNGAQERNGYLQPDPIEHSLSRKGTELSWWHALHSKEGPGHRFVSPHSEEWDLARKTSLWPQVLRTFLFHLDVECQNHSMGQVGRHSRPSPPCSNSIVPEHMGQDCIQIILEYLHVRRRRPSLRMVHVQAECLKSMEHLMFPWTYGVPCTCMWSFQS